MKPTPRTVVVDMDVSPEKMEEFMKAVKQYCAGLRKSASHIHTIDLLDDLKEANKFRLFSVYKLSDTPIKYSEIEMNWGRFTEFGGITNRSISSYKTLDMLGFESGLDQIVK